ncbi:MAG: response regulator [Desulfomonilaceae bacterium]
MQSQLAHAQKMEAIGTLAGGIAHDFNNLLQVIIGYSDFLLERKKDVGEDHSDLKKIYDAGQRGTDLVKGLLAFSRQEKAKMVAVDLNDEAIKIERLLYHTIPKNIVIELHLGQFLKPINADPSQIGQILMNLAINSKDAMPEGGKLVIETENVDLDDEYCSRNIGVTPGSYVLLSVSDTGTGMDGETLSHIFEPFFTTKSVGKGTGLGLATAYGIVKQHNGYILCYSEPGHGTTFKIYFPAISGEKKPVSVSDESTMQGGTETILLVDDDEDIRNLGARILEQKGYNVISAKNGKEGLEIYKKYGDRIGLIVLDLIMPEMDGKLCMEKILKINPGAKIVLASGYSPNGSAKTLISKGAKGFVSKPFLIKELLVTIREVLDSKEKALADLV